jgi:UPF0755 protein
MNRAGIVVTVLVAIIALACGFGAATVAVDVTQPSAASSHVVVHFKVDKGDTTTAVANRLQQAGLIRNALLFRAYARYKKLDTGIEPGVYELTPTMTMNDIIVKLQTGTPDQIEVTILDGWRVTQFPAALANLPNFNEKNFMQIAKTGKLPDGTALSSQYWYVLPLQKNAQYALEGYLFPDTYDFDRSATEVDVVKRMLDTLGEKLCPGPDTAPAQYIHDKAQCKAHAATVGTNNTSIFASMEGKYFTTDDAQALYHTLIMASIVEREVASQPNDIPGVSGVYYNRYLVSLGKLTSDVGTLMQADPTTQYARDTDTPPADGGKWWSQLAAKGDQIDPKSPYNTYTQPGLPPGPISAPLWITITNAAAPPASPYFYFLSDKCGKTHYAKTNDEFNQISNTYLTQGKC